MKHNGSLSRRQFRMVKQPEQSTELEDSLTDPDSWTLNDMESAVSSDTDSQPTSHPDPATRLQSKNQLMIDIEIPTQLSCTRCYGRGKTLEDIVVPRLPKVFQDECYPCADVSLWGRKLLSLGKDARRQGAKDPVCSIGRGRMLQDQSSSLQTELIPGKDLAKMSPRKTTPAVSLSKKPPSLLLDNVELCDRSGPVTKSKTYFCLQSCEDFPSLAPGSSASSNPLLVVSGKSFDDGSRQAGSSLSDVFEDAVDPPVTLPSGLSSHSQGTSAVSLISTSDRSGDRLRSADFFSVVGPEKDVQTDRINSFRESAVSSIPADGSSQSSDASRPDLVESLSPERKPEGADNLWQSAGHEASSCEARVDNEDPSVLKHQLTRGNPRQADKESSPADKKEAVPAEGGARAPGDRAAVRPKKKASSGWRLQGANVVHVGNVPIGCGEQLKHSMSNFGKILDSEKKSKKGVNSWRCWFESREICDYVVECLHEAVLFDGFDNALECYCLDEDAADGTAV